MAVTAVNLPRPDRLDVYYGSDLVGTVYDTTPLAFEYASVWLSHAQRMPVGAIRLQAGRQDSADVQAFFENLLPEGELRTYLAEQRKASTLFSLLLEVAGDSVGAFVMVAVGQIPEPPSYEPTRWETIAALLAKQSASAIDIHEPGARISLAGAQDKTSLAIFSDGVPHLPKGTSPSTHILKPNIRRLAKVWHSAANEAIVMRAAALAGLPTAEVFYEPHTQACIVQRFDRRGSPARQGRATHRALSANPQPTVDASAHPRLDRLVQYDLCQLAGVMSERKYEKEGGPNLADCAAIIRRTSVQAAVDLQHLVRWVFFNLYVGNNDSHAKNLSIYCPPGRGPQLSPFYDLMCTRLYPGLSQEFAFNIGGEAMPGKISAHHLTQMAKDLGMQPRYLAQQAQHMAALVPDAVAQAVREITPFLSPSACTLAERLQRFVATTTKKLSARLVFDLQRSE